MSEGMSVLSQSQQGARNEIVETSVRKEKIILNLLKLARK